MAKLYYPRLALDNIKKNVRAFLPYLLTCTAAVAMHYIIVSLSQNEGIAAMRGGDQLRQLLNFGGWVTAVFSVIILFYTSSFLVKNRKKEFGLFNILGMEKRHLARVVALETLYTALLSLAAGLALGLAFDKLMFLLIARMMEAEVPLGFYISLGAMRRTAVLFAGIYLLIYLSSVRQVHLASPIELLQGSQAGEKEPKTKRLMALLGLAFLGAGYAISLMTEDPMTAMLMFFLAVLLVIFGTYLLFGAGSIAALKLLRKNKEYYYQPRHFISVSGMIYRMKRNAAGLASICILSTMVLVTVSATASLMIGVEDVLRVRYPHDMILSVQSGEAQEELRAARALREALVGSGAEIRGETRYYDLEFVSLRQGSAFYPLTDTARGSEMNILSLTTLEDYNRLTGEQARLGPGEALLYTDKGSYDRDEMEILGCGYRVAGKASPKIVRGEAAVYTYPVQYIVVPVLEDLRAIAGKQAAAYGKNASALTLYYGLDLSEDAPRQLELYEAASSALREQGLPGELESRAAERPEARALYAGFFFLGIFLGTLFLAATILIIYYKQVSEGYEDRLRFEIMQKVGLSREEVKGSIRSQVLTVFFLPLAAAGLHTLVAFPIVRRMLLAFGLANTGLYALCTASSFLAFGALYCAVYLRTARTYYRIVSR